MPHRSLLVVLAALALLVPAAAASANSRQFTTVEAPPELLDGAPQDALDTIKSLGATAIRIQIPWDTVAPDPTERVAPDFNATDPSAYPAGSWGRYDVAINEARERGIRVHVTITGPAPVWATAKKRDQLTRPDANAFGKFATAVGRRYKADVSWWSIWNEPNLGKLLKPLKRGRKLASPTVYRGLYLKAYSGLKSAGVRAPVLLGELAPRGNSLRDIGTIAPLAFLRSMLCLDGKYKKVKRSRCGRVPTDGIAIHPYTVAVGPRFVPPRKDDVTIGVLPRLTAAIDKAAKAGALPRRLPIYITEFGVQSYPDRDSGVPLAKQSDYRSIAEHIAYSNRRVKSFSQYLLRDDDTVDGAHGKFESGLFLFKNTKPKPALQSFRLPLVVLARRRASRGTLWGFVRPAHGRGGRVTIEFKDKGRRGWRKLATQRYRGTGYWKRGVALKAKRAWRVKWTAPDGTRYTGPATRAYPT